MKEIKVGAVADPENGRVAIVFEFSKEKFQRMVELSMRDNKQIFMDVFRRKLPPKKVLKALTLGIKAIRRDVR